MYQKIMVPLDGSELAECVLPHVKKLVEKSPGTSVLLVSALENPVFLGGVATELSGDFMLQAVENHRDFLTGYLEKQSQGLGIPAAKVETMILEAEPDTVDALVNYAEKNEVELVVMATHGRSGVSRLAMGSVAEKMLKSSCIPVLMVRAPGCVAGI